jgi:hypothetical protein
MSIIARSAALLVAVVFGVVGAASPALGQGRLNTFNERDIEPQVHAFDKPGNWTLTFRFKDPRIITVDVPGRGRKIVWYMWYQIINNTGEPRFFIPDIELVTHDYESVHPDEVMPAVQAEIIKIEDPTGKLDIKNSVTIYRQPIPISKPLAYPRTITGVAIWTDVYDRAPKTNRFSIFVSGLSDAWRQDPAPKDGGPRPPTRRKTLQLNFQRLGDDIQNDANAIRWVDNPSWIYRVNDVDLTGKGKDKSKDMEPDKKLGVILEPIKDVAAKEKVEFTLPKLPTPRESLPPFPVKDRTP